MDTNLSLLRRCAGLICAGAALALPGVRTSAADPPAQADAFPTFDNYIKISGLAPSISGDSAAFATRTGSPSTGVGGIEDMSYAKDLSNDTTVTVKGHALGGSDDYLARPQADHERRRVHRCGLQELPHLLRRRRRLLPAEPTRSRRSAPSSCTWTAARSGSTRRWPSRICPVFTLSFHADTRTGQKDSSEWGAIINPNAVIVNGALSGTAAPDNTPYISPNVLYAGRAPSGPRGQHGGDGRARSRTPSRRASTG